MEGKFNNYWKIFNAAWPSTVEEWTISHFLKWFIFYGIKSIQLLYDHLLLFGILSQLICEHSINFFYLTDKEKKETDDGAESLRPMASDSVI